jgi:hypothetical protein
LEQRRQIPDPPQPADRQPRRHSARLQRPLRLAFGAGNARLEDLALNLAGSVTGNGPEGNSFVPRSSSGRSR